MNAETSDRVAGLAAVLVHLGEDDIIQAAAPGNAAKLADLASDIRAVAASALRQREEDNCATIARKIDEVTAIAVDPGNAYADEYMRGMANGLILAQSIVHGEEPEYLIAPAAATPGNPNGEISFFDRLLIEREQLAGRLAKLGDFIGHQQPTYNINFAKMDERQQLFLRSQHSFMTAYLMVLDLRITDIRLSTGQTSVNDLGAYVPPFHQRMQSLGEKLLGTDSDEADRHRAELAGTGPRCTCGESKDPCPVHEPDLQDAGPGDELRSTARQSDKPGEIIEEGVRFTKPDPDEPLPFDE